MSNEPEIRRRQGRFRDMPSAEWMKWYRESTGCSLRESLDVGLQKLKKIQGEKP